MDSTPQGTSAGKQDSVTRAQEWQNGTNTNVDNASSAATTPATSAQNTSIVPRNTPNTLHQPLPVRPPSITPVQSFPLPFVPQVAIDAQSVHFDRSSSAPPLDPTAQQQDQQRRPSPIDRFYTSRGHGRWLRSDPYHNRRPSTLRLSHSAEDIAASPRDEFADFDVNAPFDLEGVDPATLADPNVPANPSSMASETSTFDPFADFDSTGAVVTTTHNLDGNLHELSRFNWADEEPDREVPPYERGSVAEIYGVAPENGDEKSQNEAEVPSSHIEMTDIQSSDEQPVSTNLLPTDRRLLHGVTLNFARGQLNASRDQRLPLIRTSSDTPREGIAAQDAVTAMTRLLSETNLEVQRRESVISEQEDRLARSNDAQAQLMRLLDEVNARNQQLESARDQLSNELQFLRSQVAEDAVARASAERRASLETETQQQTLMKIISELEKDSEALQAENKELIEANKTLTQDKKRLAFEASKESEANTECHGKLKRAHEEIDALKEQVKSLNSTTDDLDQKLQERADEVEALQKNITRSEADHNASLKTWKKEAGWTVTAAVNWQERVRELGAELDDAQRNRADAEERARQAEEEAIVPLRWREGGVVDVVPRNEPGVRRRVASAAGRRKELAVQRAKEKEEELEKRLDRQQFWRLRYGFEPLPDSKVNPWEGYVPFRYRRVSEVD